MLQPADDYHRRTRHDVSTYRRVLCNGHLDHSNATKVSQKIDVPVSNQI